MSAKSRPRTASRVAAVQALFQAEQAQINVETVIEEFVRHRLGELPETEFVAMAGSRMAGRRMRMCRYSRGSCAWRPISRTGWTPC